MDMMKEAIKEAMLKVSMAVEELKEVIGGEETKDIPIAEEVDRESDKEKTPDKAPQLKGAATVQPDDGNLEKMAEGAMGLDIPHQSKSSFAMKLKSKMGNKA